MEDSRLGVLVNGTYYLDIGGFLSVASTVVQTEAELIARKDYSGVVATASPITLTANLTTTCALYITPGCPIDATGFTFNENGPHLSDGAYQQYITTTPSQVVIGSATPYVRPDWWTTNAVPGTTNMTSAILAAIASQSAGYGGHIQLTKAVYLYSSDITLTRNSVMEGIGRGVYATRLQASGTPTITLNGATLKNIRVAGSGAPGAYVGTGIYGIGGYSYMENVYVGGFAVGMRLDQAYWSDFKNCQFSVNLDGVDFNAATALVGNTTIRFLGCTFSSNEHQAIKGTYVPNGTVNLEITGGSVELNCLTDATLPQVSLDRIRQLTINNVYFENSAAGVKPGALYLTNIQGGKISNNFFSLQDYVITGSALTDVEIGPGNYSIGDITTSLAITGSTRVFEHTNTFYLSSLSSITGGDNGLRFAGSLYYDNIRGRGEAGISLTAATSASNGIRSADNASLDMASDDYSVYFNGSVPDWTPSASVVLEQKTDGTNGWVLTLLTTGKLRLTINTTNYDSTVALPGTFANGTAHSIGVSVIRESASADGSVSFYADGLPLGSAVAITAGVPTTVSNAVPLYVLGTSSTRTEGTAHYSKLINYALSSAEQLSLYRNGINAGQKWGTQTPTWSSDFSAGVDGVTGSGGTVDGNIDGIGGVDDTLRFYADGSTGLHRASKASILATGKYYKVVFDYYIPSTNTNLKKVYDSVSGVTGSVQDAWTTLDYTIPIINQSAHLIIYGLNAAGSTSWTGANDIADDLLYIKNVVVKEVGAVLALEPEGVQPSPGQWLDSSTNKLHALLPAAGASLTKKKDTFEIRWTNTWAGTHEAQYIGGVNQAVLPAGCYITDIIGTVSGSTGQNIVLGDGSAANRWVASVAMVNGVQTFTVANPASDGTNYKFVADPDANFTGSVAFTIRGIILQ